MGLSVKRAATSSRAREALTQYIARPPVSLKKMLVEKPLQAVPRTEFLVEVLQHLPDASWRPFLRIPSYVMMLPGVLR